MNEVINHIMDKDLEYNSDDEKIIHYLKIAQKCSKSNKIEDLVSGTLLYNQLIEHFLKETIMLSIVYIKAKLWPEKVDIDLNFDKATFGKQIEYFKKFAIKKYNRNIIIKYLNEIVVTRNKVIHNIFDIYNIKEELNYYFGKADELVFLLIEYYNAILELIYTNFDNFDFRILI